MNIHILLRDHQKKSNQVKTLQQKLKNKAKNNINKETLIRQLQTRLKKIKEEPFCLNDYTYLREEQAKREGHISELEELIYLVKHM